MSLPVIVITESESGGIWVIPVHTKGNHCGYVSKKIVNIIEKAGYARCVFSNDDEPAIADVTKDLNRRLCDKLQEFAKNDEAETGQIEADRVSEAQVVLEHSPVGA